VTKAPSGQNQPHRGPTDKAPAGAHRFGAVPSPSAARKHRWTVVADLVAVLRRRWETGLYLRAHGGGEPWQPIVLPVKGPTADELLHRFEDVRKWAAAFESDAAERMDVEYRSVGGRNFGANRIPARMRLSSFEQLCTLLGTGAQVFALDELLARTRQKMPALAAWAVDHPLVVLENRGAWERVFATVEWIAARDTRSMYLRQLDVEGVDTKFVERHHRLLSDLLPLVLPAERMSASNGSPQFARQFGFLSKPAYTRLRILDPEISLFPPGISEVTVRTDELAGQPFTAGTVFIVENEVTYLAFPPVPRAIVVFGSGFASLGLSALPWARSTETVYWGDIDTHGFDILSRLRGYLPDVRSILMDRATLLVHRAHWANEEKPARRALAHLSDEEQSLYQDLMADVYGVGVRLEQERVRFSKLRDALLPWTQKTPRGECANGR
jgi:hypothetical protein